MIIWRGLGILGVLIPAALFGALYAPTQNLALGGVGVLIGAVAVYFVGRYLNVQRPLAKLEEAVASRRQQLIAMVDAGTFYLGPGNPVPQNRAEAHAQAEALLAAERERALSSIRTQHSIFFIPLQWASVVLLVPAIGMMIAQANGS